MRSAGSVGRVVEREVLQADAHRRVVRVGDTVRRPMYPWSPSVHELLRHLADVGFPYAPRVLGVDDQGREVLTYLDGDSGGDGWARVVDEAGLRAMGRLLRDYHDAVAGFRPRTGAVWSSGSVPLQAGELVCHGDFGPWNLVWRGSRPVGVIDWDHAGPRRPVCDVAYALEYVAPFRDDAESARSMHHPAPPDRRRRLEIFAAAYGLTSLDGLADEVIAQQRQVLALVRRLAADGQQPQASWLTDGTVAATEARIAWSVRHRDLFGG